jgi:paraquat-inducible protein A
VPDVGIALCSYCDTVHREVGPVGRKTLRCVTCGSPFHRGNDDLGAMLAVTVTAAVALVAANALPLLTLSSGGHQTRATLWHAIGASYDRELPFVAIALSMTLIVAPAVELALLLWLLVPLCLRARPPGFVAMMALLRALRPWRMVEVFFLGLIVAIVKLSALATALPEWGMFGVAVVAVSLAALASFDPGALWRRAGEVAA